MTYQETCHYLYSQIPMFERQGNAGYKEGLSNTFALDEHLGHPHKSYATIHIAGTNGKGSCSHSIAAILQECGYKVGLYTSPHLVDFRERIRVNGKPISERYVTDFVERERSFFEPLHPSFFEVTTAMAFKYFQDQHVDIAVVEVGLGGRLDCTNIITPILSIITNISFDHTQFLGNTLAQIAGEKAGIIKKGVPVIIGEANSETRPVFEAKAKEMEAPIIFAEDSQEVISAEPQANGGMLYQTVHNGTLHGDLGGAYQQKNMNTILQATYQLAQMGYLCICEKAENQAKCRNEVQRAIEHVTTSTGLMGRWQVVQQNPKVVCDTGHNVKWYVIQDTTWVAGSISPNNCNSSNAARCISSSAWSTTKISTACSNCCQRRLSSILPRPTTNELSTNTIYSYRLPSTDSLATATLL